MSHMIRSTAARCAGRRAISLSIAQAAHLEEPTIVKAEGEVNQKSVTVAEYLKGLRIREAGISSPATTTQTVLQLTKEDIENGAQVRFLLIRNDIRKLQTLLLDATESSSLDTLVSGLSRQEVNILLTKLCNAQIKTLKTTKGYKQSLNHKQYHQVYKYVDTLSKRISQLYLHIQRTQLLTTDETDTLLEMLIRNEDYYRAALWIRTIDESGLGQSAYFQNAKLQVLGQTSLYKLEYNGQIIQSHKKTAKAKTPHADWGALLSEFSRVSQTVTPNLDTHKELIHGFAKANDVEQIITHIKEIWGIDESGTVPEYLIPRSSSIYPNEDLLITIISVFSHNGNLNAALPYITHFEKYYRLDLSNPLLWRVLINQIKFTHNDNKDLLVKTFKSVWNLMKHKNVDFSSGLYRLKYDILKSQEPEALKEDLQLIYSQYFKQLNKYDALRLQNLLSQYIRAVIRYVYSQNIEADEVVTELIRDYSVSKEQREYLFSKSKGIKGVVLEDHKKFEELQFLYDQEDEEDSMW